MELIQQGGRLRVLNAIATRGSFSGAADALGMSQSAASQQIAALEASLGMELIERGTRPVQLTEPGAALVRHVKAVLARLDNAGQELAEITERRHGRLRLGSFPTALATFVPGVLRRFQRRRPEVTLTVIDDHMQRLLPRLRDGELDLAVVYDTDAQPVVADNSLELVHLFDDPYRAVLPHGHRLARGDHGVALTDLKSDNWIGGGPSSVWFRIVRHTCHDLGFDPHVALVSDDYIAVQAFAEAGLGVAVIPGLATAGATRRVSVRQIRGAVPVRRIWAARLRDSYPSPAAVAMIDLFTSVTGERTTLTT